MYKVQTLSSGFIVKDALHANTDGVECVLHNESTEKMLLLSAIVIKEELKKLHRNVTVTGQFQ